MLSIVVFLITFGTVILKGHDHGSVEEELKMFHEKWTASDIVRDYDHITEDIKKLEILQKDANLTTEELAFYYHRIHDFDDNNLLDGIELRCAIFHVVFEKMDKKDFSLDDKIIATVIDKALEFDLDKDGFLSYPEFRKISP